MIGQKGVPATYGGIERHVQELATRLVAAGRDVRVYCRPHYTPRGATLDGVELVRLPSLNTKHLDAITHAGICSGHSALTRADIVHYHALGPSSLAWLPRLTRRKTIVTVHGLDWRREKWGRVAASYLRLCEWTALHFSDATIVVSRTLANHFRDRGARDVHYIPNGTDLPSPASDEPIRRKGLQPERYVLFVGRLVPEKGLHLLVRAHRRSAAPWPLVVAGGGHFTDDYVASCRREASESARFLGPVYGEELASLQQHAALVVIPSSIEGLSIALLEAMSYGRPVLGSDIPENLEVLEGVGASFRSGDADDLGRQLAALLAAPERRREMGERARARIEAEYDWDRVVEGTCRVYDTVLAVRP